MTSVDSHDPSGPSPRPQSASSPSKLAQPADETVWHTLAADEVAKRLASDAERGLSDAEAKKRLAEHGPNALTQAEGRSLWAILVAQFQSIIVVLLLVATGIALSLGEYIEAVAILVVIVLNAAIGFFTEWQAEVALTALQKQIVPSADVVRNGAEHRIEAAALTVGDLVTLSAGDRVPADGRIVESARLQIEEAALTGESHAVEKSTDAVPDEHAPLGDRVDMAFMGTTITDGRGRMLVTAVGAGTEMGKIGRLIDEATSRDTPLEQKLAKLGRLLVVVVLVLCAVIVVAGWLRGASDIWHMLELGVSLAIAAVPEGLPAVATMTLALGMQRMAKMGALIRRLPAVETLGSTTIICTDKTGTLTKNEMTACALVLADRRLDVTGVGHETKGEFRVGDQSISPDSDAALQLALRIGALCNDARLDHEADEVKMVGDPTETALIVVAEKAGLKRGELEQEYPREDESPFDSDSKHMVTVHGTPDGRKIAFVKGSPGKLLELSVSTLKGDKPADLTDADRDYWKQANEDLAGQALRVLALAYRDLPDGYNEDDLHRDLTYVGLVGMIDPLRDEAKDAIAVCREAGIRTVMITGDQQATAAEIARQLGIDHGPHGEKLRTVHARELVNLGEDDAAWQKAVADAAVFARVSPEHKLRIVSALQSQGHIVAMTGDGVNDAPALKKADIGVAMGVKGTEVAKETAAMIITDDNFATIVAAVEQGRIIYSNITRFIHYLFSCNFSEILVVFIALMIGWPVPLAALQILWLNMITDVFPALALALEPAAPAMMKRPPRDPKEALLTPAFIGLIVWQGVLLSAVSLLAFYVGMQWHGATGEGLREAMTIAFMTLALSQVFHVFNARSQIRTAFELRVFANGWLWAAIAACILLQLAAVYVPFLHRVLGTTYLTVGDWGLIMACSLAPIAVVEVVKFVARSMGMGTPRTA